MFEKLTQSLRDALGRASSPAEGRAVVAMMREALVEAKVGLANLRDGVEATRAQLAAERSELTTVERRGRLAAEIHDRETVRVATEYARRHAERIAVLERKLAAQEAELALAEGEVAEMTSQLKAAAAGIDPGGVSRGVGGSGPPLDGAGGETADGGEALRRTADRVAREAQAQRRLDELKRRMGK